MTHSIDLCVRKDLATFNTDTGQINLVNPTTLGSLQDDQYNYSLVVTTSAGTTSTCDFNLVVHDPCPAATLTLTKPSGLSDQIYYLTEASQDFVLN